MATSDKVKKAQTARFGNTVISTDGIDSVNVKASKTETEAMEGGSIFTSMLPYGNHNPNPIDDLYIPSTIVTPAFKIPSYQKFIYIQNSFARLKSFNKKFTTLAKLLGRFTKSKPSDYNGISYEDRDKVYKKLIGGK